MSTAKLRGLRGQVAAERPRPITSRFADDPVVGHLVREFVADLPDLLTQLRDATQDGEVARARLLSHRLKGEAATFGYPELAHVADELEQSFQSVGPADEEPDGELRTRLLPALEVIGRRVLLGGWMPPPGPP